MHINTVCTSVHVYKLQSSTTFFDTDYQKNKEEFCPSFSTFVEKNKDLVLRIITLISTMEKTGNFLNYANFILMSSPE